MMTRMNITLKKILPALVLFGILVFISPPVMGQSTDLSVAKSEDVDPVLAGENLTYTIVVINNGPNNALNTELTDMIPDNTTFVSATAPVGWVTTTPPVGGTGTITSTNASVAIGTSHTFFFVVKVSNTTPDDTLLSNTAEVSATNGDDDTSNNSVTVTTSVGLPQINIDDALVTEGDTSTAQACFNVNLSKPSTEIVTVDFETEDDTATAAGDYFSEMGTLTFPANDTSESICVAVIPDLNEEPNENFLVNLFNPSNATIGVAQGTGVIVDDDTPPTSSGGCSLVKNGDLK